jgi:hypothetical protein
VVAIEPRGEKPCLHRGAREKPWGGANQCVELPVRAGIAERPNNPLGCPGDPENRYCH